MRRRGRNLHYIDNPFRKSKHSEWYERELARTKTKAEKERFKKSIGIINAAGYKGTKRTLLEKIYRLSKDGPCWMSQTELGKACGVARENCWRGLKQLEKDGVVTITFRKGQTCQYEIVWEKLEERATQRAKSPVAKSKEPVAIPQQGGVAKASQVKAGENATSAKPPVAFLYSTPVAESQQGVLRNGKEPVAESQHNLIDRSELRKDRPDAKLPEEQKLESKGRSVPDGSLLSPVRPPSACATGENLQSSVGRANSKTPGNRSRYAHLRHLNIQFDLWRTNYYSGTREQFDALFEHWSNNCNSDSSRAITEFDALQYSKELKKLSEQKQKEDIIALFKATLAEAGLPVPK